jgi:hypothetical protein
MVFSENDDFAMAKALQEEEEQEDDFEKIRPDGQHAQFRCRRSGIDRAHQPERRARATDMGNDPPFEVRLEE